MAIDDPGTFVLQFGKYAGQDLDDIARTDEGLRYLDWLYGEAEQEWLRNALAAYLEQPAIAREVDRVTD